ncbi:hypothetical protein XPA_008552 [Xanthoria parietina]
MRAIRETSRHLLLPSLRFTETKPCSDTSRWVIRNITIFMDRGFRQPTRTARPSLHMALPFKVGSSEILQRWLG